MSAFFIAIAVIAATLPNVRAALVRYGLFANELIDATNFVSKTFHIIRLKLPLHRFSEASKTGFWAHIAARLQ